MANRWWTGQVGLPGNMDPGAAVSPTIKKRDREIMSLNEHTSGSGGRGDDDDDHERDNIGDDEPREGAVEAGNRRPRGRPPGSKNKPKPPIFVTRDSPNALRSHVMEVAGDVKQILIIFNLYISNSLKLISS